MMPRNHAVCAGGIINAILPSLFLAGAMLHEIGAGVSKGHSAESSRNPAPLPEAIQATGSNRETFSLKEIQDGVFQVGKVLLNKGLNTVSFPAELNMNSGPIEYFVVTGNGKLHESILRTDADPFHIQAAMLLLGAKGSAGFAKASPTTNPSASAPKPSQDLEKGGLEPSSAKLPGDPIRIELTWREGQKEVRRTAESLFLNLERPSRSLQPGKWIYNGSRVEDGLFLAQTTGSVISLITDPDALINNQGPGHDRDDVWGVNTNNIPPFKTVVQVVVILPKNP